MRMPQSEPEIESLKHTEKRWACPRPAAPPEAAGDRLLLLTELSVHQQQRSAWEHARIADSIRPAESVLHFKEIQDSREVVTLSGKKRERGGPGREEEGSKIKQQLCHLRKIQLCNSQMERPCTNPMSLRSRLISHSETCVKTWIA